MSTTLERVPGQMFRGVPPENSPNIGANVLLVCGIAASILYVIANVVGAIVWDVSNPTRNAAMMITA
jgi:hypothetical protein